MKFIREGTLERLLRGAALRTIRSLERWDRTDLRTNGERAFIRDLVAHHAAHCAGMRMVVVDGGAHVGDYLSAVVSEAAAANLAVQVHAFEPTREAFAELSARHAATGHAVLNNCALSDTRASATLFMRRHGTSQASLYERAVHTSSGEEGHTEQILTTRLDAYIPDAGIGHLHLLKLDVEGAEYRALTGLGPYLRPDFVDFIQFEYGGANLDARVPLKAFYDLFESSGFVVARQLPGGLKVRPYRTWMDNYAYANYVAISRIIHERLLRSD